MFQVFANWFALRLESVIFFQIFFFPFKLFKKERCKRGGRFPYFLRFFFQKKIWRANVFKIVDILSQIPGQVGSTWSFSPPHPPPKYLVFFVCSSVSRFIASGARFCLCPSVKNPKLVAPQNKNRRIHISSEPGVELFDNKLTQAFVIIKLPWHLAAKIQLTICINLNKLRLEHDLLWKFTGI